MKFRSYIFIIRVLVTILFVNTFAVSENYAQTSQDNEYTKALLIANQYLDINADSAIVLFKQLFVTFENQKDTSNIIKCHVGIADARKTKGQYGLAYDHLWDALFLAEDIQDSLEMIDIYYDLGTLYNIYGKTEQAEYHFSTALSLAKRQISLHKFPEDALSGIYYSIAITKRSMEKYQIALNYLDSCEMVKINKAPSNYNTPYTDAERGIIYMNLGQEERAKNLLEKAHKHFVLKGSNYAIITGLNLGDVSAGQEDWEKANTYYLSSLDRLNKTNSHTNLEGELLKKTSIIYNKIGNSSKAYSYIYMANALADSLYNAKTSKNNELFKIKNKHEETIRIKDEYIRNQNIVLEKTKLVQLRLKLFITFIICAIIVSAIFLQMRSRIKRYNIEKKQAQLDREKAEAIMQIKNKELTSYTLQIIEKDKILDTLLQKLKTLSYADYKSMKVVMAKGNKVMWEQFDKRFTEVNSEFYLRLRQKHPDLTPTEQKYCALLKLNFDSKEMVRLLNISLNTVNISRHRIRKKMGLKREENLSNYIADI